MNSGLKFQVLELRDRALQLNTEHLKMDEVLKIVNDIKTGTSNQFILMGEEPYYIDKLSD
jgi:ribosome-associated protein YbcJ (S4-like RNA binding protein)